MPVRSEDYGNPVFMEPWRCQGPCGSLIYNVTPEGYPAPGAPTGYDIEPDGQKLKTCATCTQLYVIVLENDYLLKEHGRWAASREKLKPGSNYLDGRK
jgi:hypothetical protein